MFSFPGITSESTQCLPDQGFVQFLYCIDTNYAFAVKLLISNPWGDILRLCYVLFLVEISPFDFVCVNNSCLDQAFL